MQWLAIMLVYLTFATLPSNTQMEAKKDLSSLIFQKAIAGSRANAFSVFDTARCKRREEAANDLPFNISTAAVTNQYDLFDDSLLTL